MKLINKHNFVGQRVLLDGKNFVECKFTNCNLVIEGKAIFQMDRSIIDDDCKFSVEGAAKIGLDSIKLMLHGGGWLSQVADAVLNRVREPPRFVSAKAGAAAK
jgi:hypothetical protein